MVLQLKSKDMEPDNQTKPAHQYDIKILNINNLNKA